MDLRIPIRRAARSCAVLLLSLAIGEEARGRPLTPRLPPDKPQHTTVLERHDTQRVVVKFSEGTLSRAERRSASPLLPPAGMDATTTGMGSPIPRRTPAARA